MSAAIAEEADPAPAPTPAVPPRVAIRARPPSPRRLNRKVLLAGGITIGSVVALALLVGMSDGGARAAADGQTNAVVAAAGPPESISGAPAGYAAHELGPRSVLPEDGPVDAELMLSEPPALQAPGHAYGGQQFAQMPPNASATPPPPDAQALASAAPIMFGGSPTAASAANGDGDRLSARLTPPRSRYEVMAGSIIPAALVTELNSDLPGRAIAHVTSPVYDSVTGQHLLIPQGARLLGTYDSAPSYGDNRLLLVWNRIVFPNGWSINLQDMEGTDPTGAAGLRDQVDNHLGRLAGAISLSSIISVIANEAEDSNGNRRSFAQSIGDAAAQQSAQTGGRIVDRELRVRPTLRVRAGAPVRVLVSKDIQLRPYRSS